MKLKHYIEKEIGEKVPVLYNDKRAFGRRLKFGCWKPFTEEFKRKLLKIEGVVEVGFAGTKHSYRGIGGPTIFIDRDLREIVVDVPEKSKPISISGKKPATVFTNHAIDSAFRFLLEQTDAKDMIILLEKQLKDCQNTLTDLKDIVV